MAISQKETREYHAGGRPGKTSVVPTKPCRTQRDLSLAYTPGDPSNAFRYTGKGNFIAVVSNGTSVLGLGNIGVLEGKPVMKGKAVLFKRFADIDVFDLEALRRASTSTSEATSRPTQSRSALPGKGCLPAGTSSPAVPL